MSLVERFKFLFSLKRLGPDMPLTHVCLYSKRLQKLIGTKAFSKFGCGAEFRPGAYAINCKNISIGDRVTIRPNTMLFAGEGSSKTPHITIEEECLIGSGVHIYVANHNFESPIESIYRQGHGELKPVLLKKGCWIGANVILLPGVSVGKNSVVGAGSVVTKSIPDHSVAVGNPAKIIKRLKITS